MVNLAYVGEKRVMQWIGIFKIIEEAGELQQELGKLCAFPSGNHPGREKNLIESTEKELGDLYAALDYFVSTNEAIDAAKIDKRRAKKEKKFLKWGLTGI